MADAPQTIKASGLADGFSAKEMAEAMNALFRENRIVAGATLWRGADRHAVTGIAACGPVP